MTNEETYQQFFNSLMFEAVAAEQCDLLGRQPTGTEILAAVEEWKTLPEVASVFGVATDLGARRMQERTLEDAVRALAARAGVPVDGDKIGRLLAAATSHDQRI